MPVAHTSSKGQIVIPKKIRDELGISPGTKILFQVIGTHVELTPLPKDPVSAMKGTLKGGNSLARELLEERKLDNERDEKGSL